MSNYARGTYLERLVMDRLVDAGYVVMRSAGSHGVADLCAVKPGVVLFVQCKMCLALLGSREWGELWMTAQQAGAVPIVAHRPSRNTVAYIRLLGERSRHQRIAGMYEEWNP